MSAILSIYSYGQPATWQPAIIYTVLSTMYISSLANKIVVVVAVSYGIFGDFQHNVVSLHNRPSHLVVKRTGCPGELAVTVSTRSMM